MCPAILEVSFICLLGIAVIGKIGRHVRFLPLKKKKKKKSHAPGLEAGTPSPAAAQCCCFTLSSCPGWSSMAALRRAVHLLVLPSRQRAPGSDDHHAAPHIHRASADSHTGQLREHAAGSSGPGDILQRQHTRGPLCTTSDICRRPGCTPCSCRPPPDSSTAPAGRGSSWRWQHFCRGPHSGPQLPAAGQGTRL